MNNFSSSFFYITSKRWSIIYLFFILSTFIFSCKNQQKIVLNKEKERCILEPKTPRRLTALLKHNEFNFIRLNAKLNVEAKLDSTSHSFTVSLRIKHDSIIWLSISKLGIEGARVLITKDSVSFMNRMNKTYFNGGFAYISKLLNADLDFEIIQSLFIGNSVEFYDDDEKMRSGVDNCQYFLGTIRKHKFNKVVRGKELKEPQQSIYINPETYKISKILFFEFNPDRSFDVRFSNFEPIDSAALFPRQLNYAIKAQKSVDIQINYTKLTLNEEQSFPFKIPDTYEKLAYKETQ